MHYLIIYQLFMRCRKMGVLTLQPTDMMQTFAAKMAGKPPEFEPLRAIKPPLSDN